MSENRNDPHAASKIHAFISYASEDNQIAEAIRNELVSFDLNRIEVFQDTNDLRVGDKWKDTIIFKLKQADWFIGIFTGKAKSTFSYPGYEVGIFESSHADELNAPTLGLKRIACLYDTPTFPDIFSSRQNIKVTIPKTPPKTDADWDDFIATQRIMQFFSDFTEYCTDRLGIEKSARYFEDLRKRNLKSTRAVVSEFYAAQQSYMEKQIFCQKRMEIKVHDGSFWMSDTAGLPSDAKVRADSETLSILGARVKRDKDNNEVPYTWGELREETRPKVQDAFPWMEQVTSLLIVSWIHRRSR
jgi:hypothetical protein